MDIEEAAEYLGVSTKTLRRWVSQGRIQARRVPSPTGPRFDFDPQDLDGLRVQHHPEVMPDRERLDKTGNDLPDVVPSDQPLTLPAAIPQALDILREMAGAITAAVSKSLGKTGTIDPALSSLPALMTVDQAAGYLQVSPTKVRELLREGKLRGIRGMGRGWRIKREDLRRFVEEL